MQPKTNNKSLGQRLFKAIAVILGAIILVVAAYVAYVFMSYHRIEDKQILTVINKNEGTIDDATNSTTADATNSNTGGATNGTANSATAGATNGTVAGAANGTNNTADTAKINTEYSIVTYNVGFGAYTPDYSFFMDGGKSSWAKSKDSVIETIGGCIKTLQDLDPDISLIEEIDVNATRSYHVPELDYFAKDLSYENYVFAVNYDSAFLFYPLTQPHGKTLAGIGTFSKFPITSAVRRSFPISQSFSKILDLDRCYSVARIPVENGRELVIYAVHMSAYGNSDEVREGQKVMLLQDMKEEVDKGNYVICGGDFNHDLVADDSSTDVESWAYPFPRSYIPEGLHMCLDYLTNEEKAALAPTCRSAETEMKPDMETYVLDGFIISDNVEQVSYETVDTGFEYSDHNPVKLVFKLSEDS